MNNKNHEEDNLSIEEQIKTSSSVNKSKRVVRRHPLVQYVTC